MKKLNILVPMAGNVLLFEDAFNFPKPLIEIKGRTMIEHFIRSFDLLKIDKQFIFMVNESDCRQFHLDNVIHILTDGQAKIIKVRTKTQGAACTALLAIQHINNDDPLLISNYDQLMDVDLNHVMDHLLKYDAGVITFNSVHPKWSYVQKNEAGGIVEVSEKRPISRHAIAGFYCYQQGQYFVEAAMSMIKKDTRYQDAFYISLTLNELILMNKQLSTYAIETSQYHSFYTPAKINEYEAMIGAGASNIFKPDAMMSDTEET